MEQTLKIIIGDSSLYIPITSEMTLENIIDIILRHPGNRTANHKNIVIIDEKTLSFVPNVPDEDQRPFQYPKMVLIKIGTNSLYIPIFKEKTREETIDIIGEHNMKNGNIAYVWAFSINFLCFKP